MRAGYAPGELGFTVAGSLLARLLGEVKRRGMAPEAILSEIGVSAATLQDPTARVARSAYHQAFELVATRADEPDFGLLCGERADLEAFHVVGYVLAGQRSVVELLERLSAFHRLLDDASVDTIRREGNQVTLVTQEPSRAAARPRQAAEFAVASFVTLLRAYTDGKCTPTRVAFMHPRPSSVRQHLRIFKVTPEFSCEHIEVELDGSIPLAGALPPPGLTRHLERYATELLAQLPSGDFVDRVERAVLARLSAGPPSIRLVARALGMSTRTLQRRLAEVDQSFLGVVDRVRQDAVRHHLESDDAKLDHVAAAVGFTDPRSLRRAARRWFGTGAGAIRREKRKRSP